jgi:hypothetical protein
VFGLCFDLKKWGSILAHYFLSPGFPDLAIYRHFGDFPLGFGSKILNLRLGIKWAIFN